MTGQASLFDQPTPRPKRRRWEPPHDGDGHNFDDWWHAWGDTRPTRPPEDA